MNIYVCPLTVRPVCSDCPSNVVCVDKHGYSWIVMNIHDNQYACVSAHCAPSMFPIFMNIHEYSWIFMCVTSLCALSFPTWIFITIDEYLWIFMCVNSLFALSAPTAYPLWRVWTYTNTQECRWIFMNTHSAPWPPPLSTHCGVCEHTWIFMNIHQYSWLYIHLYSLTVRAVCPTVHPLWCV
jgi:hypothetical protein